MVAHPGLVWLGDPRRLKAIQTESERSIVELFWLRKAFPSMRRRTQATMNGFIDIWLTVNGYDFRVGRGEP
jgi:hypothetical protein